MKTIVILRGKKPHDQRTVRFASLNAPLLLAGDSLMISIFSWMKPPTVLRRQWVGQDLYLQCDASPFLVDMLIKVSTKIRGCVDEYELPDQDWAWQE